MTTTPPSRSDPADDPRADYDYRSDDVDRPALVEDIGGLVGGDVRADSYSRELYATDASVYEVTPIAVVFPRSADDVAATVEYCAERGIPVLPRGGGTSLAGQTVNEAVVLDFTQYIDGVVDVDPDARRATAQPGIYLETLNETLEPHGLKFAPDPAWGDKSALGGAIGNNSTGAHSLRYGKTDAYVEEVEVVLADGTRTRFGEVAIEDLPDLADGDDLEAAIYAAVARILEERGDLIEETYPDLKRNVSGYNLDWLVEDARGATRGVGEPDAEGGTVNLAKLCCGSEGTLAIVTEATVSLEPVPETKSMALLAYDTVLEAMDDVAAIVDHDAAAVEVIDDVLIDLARGTAEFAPVTEMLPEGTGAVLIVEFYAEDAVDGERRVANLLADRCPSVDPVGDADPEAQRVGADEAVRAFDAIEAHDAESRSQIWKLRKSGLPILLSRTTDEKHIAFLEDTAVPPENLPAFVADFQAVLEDHDTYASFYAHAGPGVLHIRPLIDTKTEAGLEEMSSIADAVTDLVVEYDGSVSGEHGDGRARTQWNRKLYGEELWETFQELKTAFDPDWLLNPGQVVFRDDDPTEMTENHRFGPDYAFEPGFEPTLEWDNDNGFQGMVELCHGCGGCRGEQSTTGGVMCPTFRASEEEIASTRGRANALRQAMSGDLDPGEAFSDEFVEEVMDLCIGCKGCAIDCPSEVDMAKLKAEVTHEYHERNGSSLRDRLFANVATLSRWGSRLPLLSTAAPKLPGARAFLEATIGIDADRPLPSFRPMTFRDWFEERGGAATSERRALEARAAREPTDSADRANGTQSRERTDDSRAPERKAIVYPDPYTTYSHPEAGKAAVRVLEAAGVPVKVPDDLDDTGRPAFSKGFLERAEATARENVRALAPLVEDGWDVVVIEPSDAVMLQSDYLDLLSDEDARTLAEASYGICEYLDTFRLDERLAFDAPDESLTYHGHCHQKATAKDHHAVGVLRRTGYAVDPLDSGCCGMAGSFGYEAEHGSMSDAIASILYDQVEASPGERVVAPGASCRTQLQNRDGDVEAPPTPIEVIDAALE
ncbi:FAD-binding and (Fe-S)-binding domain-containing protein [Natronococcus jeotgali]|uniref:D-lactate dehydrogenase (cytochrome) n=1 Tax=Natronococcus jeotgali DSM 18795 TaxID=1227498 RepID=L9WM59_9EURY|nr:FAD-binding and (Fe-S)-binding domain-containing protein [Natronococcus jeotgali]ELY50555.1 FAD linked oxidase [Natronococcus jeotgali DSM 18795]